MEFHLHWVDVTMNLVSGQQPTFFLERQKIHQQPKPWAGPSEVARAGSYWVPQTSPLDQPCLWSLCQQGVHVRIPLFAVKTARALASLWAAGIQTGLAAMTSLRQHTQEVPHQVDLVLGHEVTDLASEEAFRAYLGVAVMVAR